MGCLHEQFYVKTNKNHSCSDVCANCGTTITLADWQTNPGKVQVDAPLAKVLDFVAFKKRREEEKLAKKGDKNVNQG
jgi:hypothetical protein